MSLNIENETIKRLVAEVVRMTGESETEAVIKAIEERKSRLLSDQATRDRKAQLLRLLENEIWPLVPADEVGRRMNKAEEESLLGYDSEGA